ncbi:hypothetical protein BDR06DRAFT_1002612 [Suillus hirtellus]|nr:hypothetical protein BDR06DRAFT_1002612 [Suillus hirtellus]
MSPAYPIFPTQNFSHGTIIPGLQGHFDVHRQVVIVTSSDVRISAKPKQRPLAHTRFSADATRRPVHGAHVSARHRLHPRSWASHVNTLRGRVSSLFHSTHPDAHDTPSQPRPFHWARNRLSSRPSGEGTELHERPSAVVDVPHCQAKRRNASARERRRPIIPLKSKKPASRPPNSNITQQSSGAAQAQSSSQLYAAVSTSTTSYAVKDTPSSTNPHVTIRHVGRWTRF